MDKRVKRNKSVNCLEKCTTFLISLIYLLLMCFGLYPFTKFYYIHQIYILIWFMEIIATTYYAIIYDIFGDEQSLNGLVNTFLFATHIVGHLAILAESWILNQYQTTLYDQYSNKLQQRFERELVKPMNFVNFSKRIFVIVVIFFSLLISCHGLIMWTTFETKSAASLLYWRSLPSFLALQLKSLEFLTVMAQINNFIITARKIINEIGERNLRRVFKTSAKPTRKTLIFVLSQNQEAEDEKQIKILKATYNDIYATFQLINEAYGWSLLASTAVYFVDFVCYTYWILLAVLTQGRDYFALLQNVAFALLAFILLTIMCWLCEEAYYQSRYIGCLISKLVKPLGNKHYNDLVSEFSVQTLHQRFIITAKEFFSLNLSLLGSMVAAIVTYLIILIQFMFNEEKNIKNERTTAKALVDDTTFSTTSVGAITNTSQSLIETVTNAVTKAVLNTLENSTVLNNIEENN